MDPRTAALTFRPYRPGDEPAILRAFNDVFGRGAHFVPRTEKRWRWQFARNPWGCRYLLAVTDEGEVAAQYPCLAVPLVTPEGIRSAVQVVDILVRPEWRKGDRDGVGTFALVGEHAAEVCFSEGDVLMYGYPMTRALSMGARFLEFHVLRVVDYLARHVGAVPAPAPPAIQVRTGLPASSEVDELERSTRANRPIGLVRDAQWLRWRYQQAPDDYELVQARRDGRLAGLAVLRHGHAAVARGCTFVDWMVRDGDDEAVDALIAYAESTLEACGDLGLCAIFPPWSQEWTQFRERSFGIIPSAWTMERNLTYRVRPEEDELLTRERLEAEWFYTFGDSDLA